jgi:hypothetical protein
MSKRYVLRMSANPKRRGVVKFVPVPGIPRVGANVEWHIEERELKPDIKRRAKRTKPGEILAEGRADQLYADKGPGARKPEPSQKKQGFWLRLFRAIEE